MCSSHTACLSCRSERASFGRPVYAASLISACRKRNASSPGKVARLPADQLFAHQAHEAGCDELAALRGRERDDPTDVEHLPFDGSALEQSALLGRELLEPRSKQALDCGWHRDLAGIVLALREHREHLLEEQRISPRRRGDARAGLRARALRPPAAHPSARRTPRRRAGRAGRRPCSACRRPTSAARRAAPAGRGRRRGLATSRTQSARCSIRSSNVGSAQWMSSNTSTSGVSRASASTSLRSAQKISSLTAPPIPAPIALSIRSRDGVRIGRAFEQLANAAVACRLRHDFPHGPVRDPLPVGEAAPREHARPRASTERANS